jgi:hypothetical protein
MHAHDPSSTYWDGLPIPSPQDHKKNKTLMEEIVMASRLTISPEGGLKVKEEGQALAMGAAPEVWKQLFRKELVTLAATGEPFTSEDIIAKVGLPAGGVGINANNAVGAMMSSQAGVGLIVKTGKRVSANRETSHGAELTEWVGAQAADRPRTYEDGYESGFSAGYSQALRDLQQ